MPTESLTSRRQFRSFKQLVWPSMIVRFASLDLLPSLIDEYMIIAATTNRRVIELSPSSASNDIDWWLGSWIVVRIGLSSVEA
jgi:hypothetical protein